jgi:hypothetical protein
VFVMALIVAPSVSPCAKELVAEFFYVSIDRSILVEPKLYPRPPEYPVKSTWSYSCKDFAQYGILLLNLIFQFYTRRLFVALRYCQSSSHKVVQAFVIRVAFRFEFSLL